MDNQFNSLVRSYSDNYIQFKVTGSPSYQSAFQAAEQGIQNIIKELQIEVDIQKDQIANFYKSGVEKKLTDLEQRNRFLQRGIIAEKDEITAAQMRSDTSIVIPPVATWQYITLGVLAATAIGLSVL